MRYVYGRRPERRESTNEEAERGEERREEKEAYLDTDLAVALRANEFLHALLHDLRFDERGNHC